MDSRDWRLLATIEEEKSLTRTAARLYISQPSLSYWLQKLEREFETTILVRHSSGVSFTREGTALLRYAKEMLERYEEIKSALRPAPYPVLGNVRIGISTVLAKYWFAPILKAFTERFPMVDLEVVTGSSTLELPIMLSNHQVDIIVKRGDMPWDGVKHYIAEEPKGIISSRKIDLDRLAHEALIQNSASVITGSDKVIASWWRERFGEGRGPRVLSVNSVEACLEMVAGGIGWAFLPRMHLKNRPNLHFMLLTLANGETVLLKTVMLGDKEAMERPAVRSLVDFIMANRPGRHEGP